MPATTPNQLYEADFQAWTKQQAVELRRFAKTRPNLPPDLEHLAEEIRDLGESGTGSTARRSGRSSVC